MSKFFKEAKIHVPISKVLKSKKSYTLVELQELKRLAAGVSMSEKAVVQHIKNVMKKKATFFEKIATSEKLIHKAIRVANIKANKVFWKHPS